MYFSLTRNPLPVDIVLPKTCLREQFLKFLKLAIKRLENVKTLLISLNLKEKLVHFLAENKMRLITLL